MALVVLVALASKLFSESVQLQFQTALVVTAMVVGLYTFTGNSGVISFGHVSFVGVGAFAAGMMSVPVGQKAGVFPRLFGPIKDHELGNIPSLLLGMVLAAVFALIVGAALVRLNGLAAGIATLAALQITRNVLRNWDKIGPGAKAIPSIPQTTGLLQATWCLLLMVVVAYLYQRSPWGRRLRASREDAFAAQGAGVGIYRERLIAFTLSGAMCGLAGGVYVHLLGSVTTDQVYLKLTFLMLAMLVIGGTTSQWGAVVGGLLISAVNSFLFEGEKGQSILGLKFTLPAATSEIAIALVMAIVLLLRPTGVTRGREFLASRR